jgi:mRNA interferase MazF
MRRGDLYIASVPGDYGKPRPVVIIQNDAVNEIHDSIVVCLVSSYLVDAPVFRLVIEPTARNGLTVISQIMVDKVFALKRERLHKRIGRLSEELLLQLGRLLAFWIGI